MAIKQIYDPIRNQWISKTPEEEIRQHWILVMIEHLGYPKELMVVEKSLAQLPTLDKGQTLPRRRLDLLVYHNFKGKLEPLLLIEFKKESLNQKALYQVQGYNHYIHSKFIACANQDQILFGFFDFKSQDMISYDFLPEYKQLVCS